MKASVGPIVEKLPIRVDSTVQTEYLDQLDASTIRFKIKEEVMNSAVERACRKAAGLQREKE